MKIDERMEAALRQRHHAQQQEQQTAEIGDQLRGTLFSQKRMEPAPVRTQRKREGGAENHGYGGRRELREKEGRGGHGAETEHGCNHPEALCYAVSAEQGKEQHHCQQGIDPAENTAEDILLKPFDRNNPAALKAGEQSVAETPENKGPVRTVPESRAEEDNEPVQRGAGTTLPVSSERIIQVLPEPGGQGDMPLPPEVTDGRRGIGKEKVLLDRKAEHAAHANGHVAVAGEIKVDLQRVADSTEPGKPCIRESGGENGVNNNSGGVSQEKLLAEADDKAPDAGGSFLRSTAALVNLRGDIAPADNGTGNQLRKKGDIKQKLQKAAAVFLRTAVDINRIAESLKGEKRDPDRENQPHRADCQPQEGVGIANQKVGILIDAENPQIEKNVKCDQNPAAGKAAAEQQSGQVVEENRAEKQRNIVQVPEGIEDQTGNGQKNVLISTAEGELIQQKDCRQKAEEENRRAEYQTAFLLPPRISKQTN